MTKQDLLHLLETDSGAIDPQEKESLKRFLEEELADISDTEDISKLLRQGAFPSLFAQKDKHSEEDVLTDDLIFSRPPIKAKAPEIIHSMENREVKTLFGEKVMIENRKDEIPEIVLEPIDRANGLTDEEIMEAKAHTLEKTEKFAEMEAEKEKEEEKNAFSDNTDVEKIPVYIEEEDDYQLPELKIKKQKIKKPIIQKAEKTVIVKGLIDVLCEKMNLDRSAKTGFAILLTLVFSPIILSALIFVLGLYLAALAAVLSIAVALFLLVAVLVAIGVIELIYGVVSLFKSVPVALVELGLGTVLFSLVTALVALMYQFLFGVMPTLNKKISHFFLEKINRARLWLYGGKV